MIYAEVKHASGVCLGLSHAPGNCCLFFLDPRMTARGPDPNLTLSMVNLQICEQNVNASVLSTSLRNLMEDRLLMISHQIS